MKIVLLSPLSPPAGGIASWTERVLSSSIAKEHEIYVVNTAVSGKRVRQLIKRGIIGEIKRSLRIFKDLRKACRTIKPDIVHINTSCGKFGLIRDYYSARLARRYRSKVLLHCHCDVSYQIKNSGIGQAYFKKLSEISDKIIVLNTASKKYISRAVKRDSIIMPHFIIEDTIPDINKIKDINSEIRKVMFAGHVTKAKGCDIILKVAESFPDIKFYLYGYISNEIACLPKKDNVYLKGEVSHQEIMNEYSTSDLFLFPTLTEGFPMALLEAMAHGLPCVATNAGAIPDMIETKGGIILKPERAEDFINAIKALNENRELRVKMSLWNKEKVRNCYTQRIVLKEMIEIYKNILK